ncbi:unnamed protein product, partial [marine sediment metagenome]
LDGLNLFERVLEHSNFDFSGGGGVADNLIAELWTVSFGHAALVIDWSDTDSGLRQPADHRENLLNPFYREIGLSIQRVDEASSIAPALATQHLATDFFDGPYLTGLVYQDIDRDEFYSLGEGLAGLDVELRSGNENVDEVLLSTQTRSAGGYSLNMSGLDAGRYYVSLNSTSLQPTVTVIEWTGSTNVSAEFADPIPDIDLMTRLALNQEYSLLMDLDRNSHIDIDDRRIWIEELQSSYFGDANLD